MPSREDESLRDGDHGGVLIVDDDRGIRDALSQILADEGHPVSLAANGLEALHRLSGGPQPCCILLDLMMPVMSGWEFMSRRREDSRFAAIPVVVISADATVEKKAEAVGAEAYLQKPVDLGTLIETVDRYCAGAR